MKLCRWITKDNRYRQWLILVFLVILELVFHWEIYGKLDGYMINAVFFALSFSAFVQLVSGTGHKKWDKISRCSILLLVLLYFVVQLIYHQVFGNFLSLKSIWNGAEQAMDFGSTIWDAFLEHVVVIVGMVSFWGLLVYFTCRMKEENMTWKRRGICGAIMLLVPVVLTFVFMAQGAGAGSTYDVKISFHRTEQSMYRLGLLQTLKKDITENLCQVSGLSEARINGGYLLVEKLIEKKQAVIAVDSVEQQKITMQEASESKDAIQKQEEVRYHTWDIDFEKLIALAGSTEEREVHTYFSGIQPTRENVYTGLFEGYNLIYITAESFSDVLIDKERTPTLYKMQQEGFQFSNFYTPSWYLSTIDGEYVNMLGQIPVEGEWSLQRSAENALPVALGNQLAKQGYLCNGYHNHDSYYYDRTITHPKLGYAFKAVGAGLTFESMYPESDLELMEITVDEYIGKEPFQTYYMTMSGHLPYTYDYNSMAVKNRDKVQGEWSEQAACYLAANVELELAVTFLIEELEKKNQLEKTLFVVVPDHYPYGLKKGAYDELRGKEVEQDAFEVYRNTCLIWSTSMADIEEIQFPVQVDKCCSNLDLLPTISNLMGVSYDARLLAGRDMLSEDMGLVLFKDHSFLTDKVRYNATTGETTWAAGQQEDLAYLESCMEIVKNRFYYSAKVLELDYYQLVQSGVKEK